MRRDADIQPVLPTGFEAISVSDDAVEYLRKLPSEELAKSDVTTACTPKKPEESEVESDLAELISVWPKLSEEAKAAILAIIRGNRPQR
jgi:hypothetical protein